MKYEKLIMKDEILREKSKESEVMEELELAKQKQVFFKKIII